MTGLGFGLPGGVPQMSANPVPPTAPRMRIRVEVAPQATTVPQADPQKDHWLVERGTHEVLVYRDDHLPHYPGWPSIQKMVETDTVALARARESHERKLREHVQKVTKGVQKEYRDEAERNARASYTGNVEAEFTQMTGRGVHPLICAEVLDDNVPPPEPADLTQLRKMAELQAGAAAAAMKPLIEMMANMQAELAALKAERRAPKGQG